MSVAKKYGRKSATPPLVGDLVLIGRPGITMPRDWFIARVLWSDGREALTEHESMTGFNLYREVRPVSDIRAIGSIRELALFRRACKTAVRERSARVDESIEALRRARADVWAKLDEIGSDGPRETAETAS